MEVVAPDAEAVVMPRIVDPLFCKVAVGEAVPIPRLPLASKVTPLPAVLLACIVATVPVVEVFVLATFNNPFVVEAPAEPLTFNKLPEVRLVEVEEILTPLHVVKALADKLSKLPLVNELLPIVNGLMAVDPFQFQVCAKSPLAILLAAVDAVILLIGKLVVAAVLAGDNQPVPSHKKLAVLLIPIV